MSTNISRLFVSLLPNMRVLYGDHPRLHSASEIVVPWYCSEAVKSNRKMSSWVFDMERITERSAKPRSSRRLSQAMIVKLHVIRVAIDPSLGRGGHDSLPPLGMPAQTLPQVQSKGLSTADDEDKITREDG